MRYHHLLYGYLRTGKQEQRTVSAKNVGPTSASRIARGVFSEQRPQELLHHVAVPRIPLCLQMESLNVTLPTLAAQYAFEIT